ncbi:DUF7793 family protein [Pontibacter anaerobius]|uniref:DUF7793 domain-containing protein n=1 Tax=Pontibacter anaerobius TaxID=2993940 RepID=A0ABT3REI1_9BACT|nr:hypothetical protein [Pontibacter anaerobius]MCX2739836.1 hypothetical protein [Pontibacter anaerobius]
MANFEKDPNIRSTKYINLAVDSGILHCVYKDIELLDLDIAKICVQDRLEFIQGETYPSLFDITRIKQSTKEARDYLANEGNDFVSASAILISSPMVRMSANFFIQVNKPKNPTRMFTNQPSALEWLAQYKG